MKKKIVILLLAAILAACSFNRSSEKVILAEKTSLHPYLRMSKIEADEKKQQYDTISFGSETARVKYTDTLLITNTISNDYMLLYETTGKGIQVWLRDLLYLTKLQNQFFGIATACDQGSLLFYFNGDSLQVENWIHAYNLSVEECRAEKFKVIIIREIKEQLLQYARLYKISDSGLSDEQNYYFKPEDSKGLTIEAICKKDSVVILKNGKPDYIYK